MRLPQGSRKSRKRPGRIWYPRCSQSRPYGFLVIDHQSEVSPIVAGLLAAFLKGKKLIAQIDESGVLALAAQREFKQSAVGGQSLLDVADLERDVVQSDSAGFAGLGHGGCLQMSHVENVVRTRLPANVDMRTP